MSERYSVHIGRKMTVVWRALSGLPSALNGGLCETLTERFDYLTPKTSRCFCKHLDVYQTNQPKTDSGACRKMMAVCRR